MLLSSHTIPGNEETTHGVINRLFQRGADVYYGALAQAHVSGHASQEELKLLINLLRPRFFVPIHGELRHLVQHAKLAHELGIAKKDIAVVENGYPLTFDGERMQIGKRVPGDYVFVDGSLVGEVGPTVMRQRDELAQSGFVTAVARYDRRAGKRWGSRASSPVALSTCPMRRTCCPGPRTWSAPPQSGGGARRRPRWRKR